MNCKMRISGATDVCGAGGAGGGNAGQRSGEAVGQQEQPGQHGHQACKPEVQLKRRCHHADFSSKQKECDRQYGNIADFRCLVVDVGPSEGPVLPGGQQGGQVEEVEESHDGLVVLDFA